MSILSAVSSILKMLDTLMDISEAETGTMNMYRKQVDICDLIEKIADMYAFVAEEKGIDMDINFPENLYISIDSDRMGQAISNILDNAVKFTAPGGHIHINAGRFNKDVIIYSQFKLSLRGSIFWKNTSLRQYF